jgi:sulfide dehydrogenase [flavocytochrome c] flavoprotein subunit
VTAIDPAGKTVALKGGKSLPYDHLVVAPGIGFRWGEIEGYDEAASEVMPHSWKAGPQTILLRKQLEAMEDGGVVIISVPGKPFRAPPAPYERASIIANYLSEKKPKSKVLILDSSDDFVGRTLFMKAWEDFYPGMIEWVKGSEGGRVERVEAKALTVHSASGQSHKGNVVNVIPPQKAGEIAHAAGLVNEGGWCPVDQRTFESAKHEGVHVIGDSCIAGEMPKGATAASTQAKVCAAAIVSSLTGAAMPEPVYLSFFHLLIKKRYAISDVGVFRLSDGQIKQVSGGPSPEKAKKKDRRKEAQYGEGWYKAITAEAFG